MFSSPDVMSRQLPKPCRRGTENVVDEDHTLVGPLWEGYHESSRCFRDTYPESYITKFTSLRSTNASREAAGSDQKRETAITGVPCS